MSYNELIKNFGRIRDYMRDFYIGGFKSRGEYDKKSARSYDDERRRLESWLGDYMGFRQTVLGKNVFIAIDSRLVRHNPLYKAWKAKSFTDGDITLHFLLFDILDAGGIAFPLNQIMEKLDTYLADVSERETFDASTVRKKLKEYGQEGLILTEKQGKTLLYRRGEMIKLPSVDLLDFFSEIAPCGVIGSYLLDKLPAGGGHFAFKHHYITQALDCGILCALFNAMRQKRGVELSLMGQCAGEIIKKQVVPLRIFISVQGGRQYLMADYKGYPSAFRLDRILCVQEGECCEEFDHLRDMLDRMQQNIWGVSTRGITGNGGEAGQPGLERVEFIIRYDTGQEYIHDRLMREKRCGRVEKMDAHRSRFIAEVYDSSELVPWIRTFLGRIESIRFSNKKLARRFQYDLKAMYQMYGIIKDGKEDVS
ncbi:MAG: WYL domain-containing protein [Lachnospiraceae bacterium]|nr:WYL domain-containing protein [Lachnospiraceae bacterium]